MRRYSCDNEMWAYYEWLDYMEEMKDYENEIYWEAQQQALDDEEKERIVQLKFKSAIEGDYDTHHKPDRHCKIVKGFVCKSGRTIRPTGRHCNRVDPKKVTDDSRKHVNRFLRQRRVRKCDCCKTHVCKNNIPIRGRQINTLKYNTMSDAEIDDEEQGQEHEQEEEVDEVYNSIEKRALNTMSEWINITDDNIEAPNNTTANLILILLSAFLVAKLILVSLLLSQLIIL